MVANKQQQIIKNTLQRLQIKRRFQNFSVDIDRRKFQDNPHDLQHSKFIFDAAIIEENGIKEQTHRDWAQALVPQGICIYIYG